MAGAAASEALPLAGKVALVTGSTSGIGLGIAIELAKAGASLRLHGLGDPAEITATVKTISADYGVDVTFVPGDLSSAEGVTQMMAAAGDVDILVNNAGIQHVSPVEHFPADKWDKVIAINLTAPFLATKAALPSMFKKGWGRLVHIASAHGKVASANKAAYVAAKHGLVGLSKVTAVEAGAKQPGVTSNCICPGWVKTPLVQKQIEDRAAASGRSVEDETLDLLKEKHPNCRFTTPAQIGASVVFLCSPAADNVTGTELSMDGGWTAV
mmetsp:Transcript_35409/g.92658  ORF Transcript_35409/g.92658 Transcript_35409/m.92658 type:complete len:269 (+) Transcript_35409:42-848(+)|eukprot:CAMPEP_0182922448 /NCGR_PEP_ID=MMETSP0105_2-20130417/4804_1 /TAXON_ID=81532 ORGANISM="Acanthoeca-like sp., Strain 10tr" /NCGR_SAMPLE_ID=MMETSP0105_2 /ASSEMBLY_ACC=CAM_ASM_000205 /LENGTH=268 /DNA_ID=CAMNT_0025060065 /DNA_START=27 /DNA_END=833 /DNA_ORIENTATION=-